MQPPMSVKSADDFQTPAHAIIPLLSYIPKTWTIWECACGRNNLVRAFGVAGYSIIGTDIEHDFLKNDLDMSYDVIITNPPYSIKQSFLIRCYDLGKPFALLLPLTTFETKKRQGLFAKHGVEVIFMPTRINFETPSGRGKGAWFATAWFTWGLNIGKALTFWGVE